MKEPLHIHSCNCQADHVDGYFKVGDPCQCGCGAMYEYTKDQPWVKEYGFKVNGMMRSDKRKEREEHILSEEQVYAYPCRDGVYTVNHSSLSAVFRHAADLLDNGNVEDVSYGLISRVDGIFELILIVPPFNESV